MSRARVLADRANQNTLALDTTNSEVGIASTVPSATLDVRGEVKVGTTVQLGSAGVVTATSFSGSGESLTGVVGVGTLNVRTESLTVSGASTFSGGSAKIAVLTDSTSSTTGALIVDGGLGVAKNVYIGAGLSVAGTLTYEDVTSVDSVGLITAKSGVNVSGGQLQVGVAYSVGAAGVATAAGFVGGTIAGSTGTFTGDVDIADKIVHTGDTNTAIRFPSADTITAETGGTEAFRVDSSQRLLIGTTTEGESTADDLTIANSGSGGITIRSGTSGEGNIFFSDGTSGTAEYEGTIQYNHGSNYMLFFANHAERLRITSAGDVGISTAAPASKLHLYDAASDGLIVQSPSGLHYVWAIESAGNLNNGSLAGELGIRAQSGLSISANNGTATQLRITSAGKCGIGTTNPQQLLHIEPVSGDSYVQIDTNGNGGILLDVQGTQRSVFANDSAFSGNLINTAIGAKNNLFIRSGSSYTERLQLTDNGGFLFSNGELVERCNITAGKLSDNTNIDLEDGMVHYFTTQESTTSTPNIRVSSSTSLNDVMDAGDIITVTVITTAAAAGYSANWTIDGNAVTEEWVGGSAPSAGGSNGLDIYVLTIICTHATNTGDSGFKVIANLTNAT